MVSRRRLAVDDLSTQRLEMAESGDPPRPRVFVVQAGGPIPDSIPNGQLVRADNISKSSLQQGCKGSSDARSKHSGRSRDMYQRVGNGAGAEESYDSHSKRQSLSSALEAAIAKKGRYYWKSRDEAPLDKPSEMKVKSSGEKSGQNQTSIRLPENELLAQKAPELVHPTNGQNNEKKYNYLDAVRYGRNKTSPVQKSEQHKLRSGAVGANGIELDANQSKKESESGLVDNLSQLSKDLVRNTPVIEESTVSSKTDQRPRRKDLDIRTYVETANDRATTTTRPSASMSRRAAATRRK